LRGDPAQFIALEFCVTFNNAQQQHPGHSTISLRSESLSSMCAKLCTVAASNNRVHPVRSLSSSPLTSTINCSPGSQALLEVTHQDHSITLLLLVRATNIWVLFFMHIPFVVNHTFRAMPVEWLQHSLAAHKFWLKCNGLCRQCSEGVLPSHGF